MSFDRAVAARHWRISILSRGGLTVSEVDELEDHLEQVEERLLEHLQPEEAFWVAAHRVGTPEALTREFALVRPNFGWELRAQWALIGLLASWLWVPLASAILSLLAAIAVQIPPVAGVAAVVVLYGSPLAYVLALLLAVVVVRRLGALPTGIDRAVGYLAANPRPGLLLAAVGVIAWQASITFIGATMRSHAMGVLYAPGEPWPLQSGLWYMLLPVVHYAVPVLVLILIVRMQQRLESVRFAQA
jgi:hypothetical protein